VEWKRYDNPPWLGEVGSAVWFGAEQKTAEPLRSAVTASEVLSRTASQVTARTNWPV